MSINQGKLLYHLTSLDNLDSIIQNGLASRRALNNYLVEFKDVANEEIINFRNKYNLDKYVPFHFYPYTPFDWDVKNNNQDKELIYICIERELARKNNFEIIPMHPLSMHPFMKYPFDEGMSIIDWDTMELRDYTNDRNKSICMAECITDKYIPISCMQSIGVKNSQIKELVEDKIKIYEKNNKIQLNLHIDIREQWFRL